MECEESASAANINKRKMDFLVERNFTCMLVQRNCMCKHKSFVKHEIGSAEDRTRLMIDHKKRNPTYINPASDLLKKWTRYRRSAVVNAFITTRTRTRTITITIIIIIIIYISERVWQNVVLSVVK